MCVNQEANVEVFLYPVRALGRRYVHIRKHTESPKTYLSAYFVGGVRHDITDQNIRNNLKWAAKELDYPASKGILIDHIDTHSLRGGGANALHLNEYSDRQIQKMGRWRGATFKEYISNKLACFSEGMSKNMKRKFNFVNVAAGAFSNIVDVTSSVLVMEFNTTSAHTAAAC